MGCYGEKKRESHDVSVDAPFVYLLVPWLRILFVATQVYSYVSTQEKVLQACIESPWVPVPAGWPSLRSQLSFELQGGSCKRAVGFMSILLAPAQSLASLLLAQRVLRPAGHTAALQ